MIPEHVTPVPGAATTVPATVAAARFCGMCGDALAGDPPACARCAATPTPAAPITSVRRQFASLRSSFLLYFGMLAVCVGAAIAYILSDDAPESTVSIDMTASAAFALVVALAALRHRRLIADGLTTPGRPLAYPLAVLLSLATYAVASILAGLSNFFIGTDEVPFYTADYHAAGYSLAVMLLFIAVQPAIFEEIAFRGIIGRQLDTVLGPRDALLVTAFLFAILHLSPFAFPHLAVIGLTLGVLRRRSGSLYPCMLLHFCHNALVVLAERFPETIP